MASVCIKFRGQLTHSSSVYYVSHYLNINKAYTLQGFLYAKLHILHLSSGLKKKMLFCNFICFYIQNRIKSVFVNLLKPSGNFTYD
jgi:hypothetical protein